MKEANSFSSLVGAPKLAPLAAVVQIASVTASLACPKISGPHEQQKSMNSLPSASQTWEPFPLSKNKGFPPTDLNARTGEFTPPGKYFFASTKSASLLLCFMVQTYA